MLIDPVSAIHLTYTSSHYELHKQNWNLKINMLLALSQPDLVVVMTSCLVQEMEWNRAQFEEYKELAEKRNCGLCVVHLHFRNEAFLTDFGGHTYAGYVSHPVLMSLSDLSHDRNSQQ